ncbi:MAG: hypothetical protein CVU47_06360 [Chloroflexi bacterium HGW-Chloroflexi-9]|nr:MAG: hypothetical protein CVU47_06360 [Chloroflexi bacterium HGW-Chloroflexi-9]
MAGAASVNIQVSVDARRLNRALQVLAEPDAPFLRQALEESGRELASAAASRAPGSIASTVAFAGVKGRANRLRATVVVKHPAAKAREFGRQTFYRSYEDRRMKATGVPFKAGRRGQKAQPFIGIVKGNAAIGAVGPGVRQRLERAVTQEWDRIAAEGDA